MVSLDTRLSGPKLRAYFPAELISSASVDDDPDLRLEQARLPQRASSFAEVQIGDNATALKECGYAPTFAST